MIMYHPVIVGCFKCLLIHMKTLVFVCLAHCVLELFKKQSRTLYLETDNTSFHSNTGRLFEYETTHMSIVCGS